MTELNVNFFPIFLNNNISLLTFLRNGLNLTFKLKQNLNDFRKAWEIAYLLEVSYGRFYYFFY